MTPTDLEIQGVRSWLGDSTPPTDEDIYAQIIAMESVEKAAHFFLRARLGNLTAEAASYSAEGVSYNNAPLIPVVQEQLAKLEALLGSTVGSIELTRVGMRRR